MEDKDGWGKKNEFKSPLEHINFIPQNQRRIWFEQSVLPELNRAEIDQILGDADVFAPLLGTTQDNLEERLQVQRDYLDLFAAASKRRRSRDAGVQIPTEQWDVLPNRNGKIAKKLPGPDSMGLPTEE